jgi:hypothetical protein
MLRNHQMLGTMLFCVLAVSEGSCIGAEADVPSDEAFPVNTPATSVVPAVNVKFDMYSGRLANVPVSSYYASPTINLSGSPDKWFFYASCRDQNVNTGGGKNVSDVSVVLINRDMSNKVVDISYADTGSPCGHGGTSGGMLYARADSATYKYNFFVVSNRRNTALCTIGRAHIQIPDANGPGTCGLGTGGAIMASNVQVGGTLIKVGPLPEGDTFEVQTPANGRDVATDQTNMLLLRMDTTGRPAYTWGAAGTGDNDPKLTVPRGYSDTAENFILLGKADTSRDSNEGVETRVDLLHGPLNYLMRGGTFVPGGSVGQYLTPGRWNIEITGKPAYAVGDEGVAWNTSTCGDYHRGTPNQPGFTYRLDKNASGTWSQDTSVAQRLIPVGAFGNAANLQSLYLNKEVVAIGAKFRPVTTNLVGNWTWGTWNVHRNPDNSTIRFVTQNMLYRDSYSISSIGSGMVEDDVNEYKNAAHLFGGRSTVTASALRVNDPTDRGPHEWDGDVVVLTEGNDTPGTPRRLDAFKEEATSTGSRSWVGTEQIGEDWFTAHDSNNMILVASNVNGGLVCEKDDAPVNQGRCRRRSLVDHQNFTIYNYMVPGFVNARRQIGATQSVSPAASTPVAVMAVHLEPDDKRDARLHEVKSLAAEMKDILQKNANRVNRNGHTDPLGNGNRFVVIGDVNVEHHKCGETNWLLRILRDNFGYAVDIAMAMDDSTGNDRHYAMHNQGATLIDGTPSPYQTKTEWQALSTADQWKWKIDSVMKFPWWSGTYIGQRADAESGSHERYDQIWLVGRGWEKDDVGSIDYKVLNSIKVSSPFSLNHGPYGVETWKFKMTGMTFSQPHVPFIYDSPYRLSGSTTNTATCSGTAPYDCDYRPYFGVLGGGTALGDAAIHTDHLGIMSTIPIFGGAGFR